MYTALTVIFSILFAVTHIGMTIKEFRDNLVSRLGEMGYKGVYSAVSIITLAGAIFFFVKAREDGAGVGPLLWYLPYLRVLCPLVLMFLAVPLVVFGFVQPSPTGMVKGSFEPKPIHLVTRHPVNMGLALFGLAHCVAKGYLGDVALFGSIFVVGFFGAYHQDARKAKSYGADFDSFREKTSVIPFQAVLLKKNNFNFGMLNIPLLIFSVLLYGAIVLFHGRLFGVGIF